nr:MAG: replication initiator protein [Microvirus sp.]
MKCGDPVLCYTAPSGKKFYRHFSLASWAIIEAHQQVFNCGKCLHCRKRKAYELAMRCVLHASMYTQNCFLTLTYNERKEGYHNNFEYSDIQKFKKRLRSYCFRRFGKRIEIFNVHEYGKNGKKHWHLIVFNHDFSKDILRDNTVCTKELHSIKDGIPVHTSSKLDELWDHGFHTIGDVCEASAMYQAQYMEKDLKNGNYTNNKKSNSKHSGIGKPYFLKHYDQLLTLGFVPFGGKKIPIPRYFEKLGHKHYSHFFETENFFDLPYRKALYRPFKNSSPDFQLALKFKAYLELKKTKVQTMIDDWDEFISSLTPDSEPDFIKSLNNNLYDLKNKVGNENF